MENLNNVDLRTKMAALDDETKATLATERKYDPSVFIEVIQRGAERILLIPATKRMAWFKLDNPTGVVVTEPPIFNGRRVTVIAKVYKNRDDYQNGIPMAVNMASRLMDDRDMYSVDSCVTRAQSRALRDAGYDLPMDAHEIQGWTPVKVMDGTAPVPEDALESSATMSVAPNPATLQRVPDPMTVPELAAALEQAAALEPAKTAAPETAAAALCPVGQETPDAPPAISEEATPAAEAVNATPNQDTTSAPKMDAPAAPSTVDSVQGNEMFASLEDAMAYSCRQLGGKTVGEQDDRRVSYYAKRAQANGVRDPKLACAMLMVAQARGIL